jgi:hypothetical protein
MDAASDLPLLNNNANSTADYLLQAGTVHIYVLKG